MATYKNVHVGQELFWFHRKTLVFHTNIQYISIKVTIQYTNYSVVHYGSSTVVLTVSLTVIAVLDNTTALRQ